MISQLNKNKTRTGWNTAILRTMAGAALVAMGGSVFGQTAQTIVTRYQHDAQGNLTRITDPLGRVTDQSYDALNRLTRQLQPAPAPSAARPAIDYAYDGLDQLTTVTDPRRLATAYTTDGLGDRTVLSSPDTGAAGSTYDEAGNLLTHTDARGKTTSYAYDLLNRVTRIAYADGSATGFEYDGGGAGAPNAIGRLTRIADESS